MIPYGGENKIYNGIQALKKYGLQKKICNNSVRPE